MDSFSDLHSPAVLFTLLAIIIAAVITVKNKSASLKYTRHNNTAVATEDNEESSYNNDNRYCRKTHHPETQSNAKKFTNETIQPYLRPDHEEEDCRLDQHNSSSREDSSEYGIRNALKDYALSPDADEKPLRYMAGMLRTSQLEKMMTKEELEEEKRVQRDQLAAIFQLLKEKQETFGDVSESDLQDQLKLYSI